MTTSYKDNPNLGIRVVTTVEGDKEYRANCKHILDRETGEFKFYVKNRDCFPVGERWFRKTSPYLVFDNEKKEYLHRYETRDRLIKGIIDFKDGEPVIGEFTINPFNNVRVSTGRLERIPCINVELLKNKDFVEDLGNGNWYHVSLLGGIESSTYRKIRTIRSEVNYRNKGYNIEDNGQEYIDKKTNFDAYKTEISKDTQLYARFLGDISFGAEIELSEGFIPTHIQNRMGIVMCRDGSISGGEAVTVPMTGAKGLQNLKDIANEFKDRANVDIHCSYHLHIGTIPTDRAYICALYILAYKIQNEIFEMFPYYKTDPEGIKRKNYCQKLSRMQIHPLREQNREGYGEYIDEVYSRIFEFLSDGHPLDKFNNRKSIKHPIQNKWDRPSRYKWLNLQNMIFGGRNTAEFRLHQATLNDQKMTLWLFICNAIVKYAENHQREIITSDNAISMKSVLNYYREHFSTQESANLSEHLIAYFEERKAQFAKDIEKGDKISEKDANNDKRYSFSSRLF